MRGVGEIEQTPEAFNIVVHLHKLIVQCCVGDRSEMKDRVEFLVAELLVPIERREVLRDEIAFVTGEVLEIAGAKIVDHGQARVRHPFLEGENEVGADETGAARYQDGSRRRQSEERGVARA